MIEAPPQLLLLLAALLLVSGLFSSAETAFFSLTPRQRAASSAMVRRLLSDPRRLLLAVLVCNLVVNVLFFAFAGRLLPHDQGMGDVTVSLGALVALVVFGEILPKTLGLRARTFVARFTARPLAVAAVVISPVGSPLVRLLEKFNRKLSLWFPEERGLTPDLLARVLERGGEDGSLLATEVDLLGEIVELEEIRVREIMTPRVDVVFVDITGKDRGDAVRAALEARQAWVPVVDSDPDRVVGVVPVRDLLRRPDRNVRQLVMPVKFVPEVASALDLLRGLRQDRTGEAVVVDEWGGTAGFVTDQDVFEEIVGDLRAEDEVRQPDVVPLGEGRFRVPGRLSIRDWNDAFGLSVVPVEFETVGGFVTALLGHIPRAGEVARAGGLEMEVHEMRGRRVFTVDIGVDKGVSASSLAGADIEEEVPE